MIHVQKRFALILALLLVLTLFAACAKNEAKKTDKTPVEENAASGVETEPVMTEPVETAPAQIGGETEVYGDYAVLVPEGFTLEGPASEFSYYDFTVHKSTFSYFDFTTSEDDDTIMRKYNYNKDTYTNEQEDVEAVYGELTWTGFQYSDGWGGYGFEAYTTVNGKLVRVSSAGFRFDSEEAKAILASLSPASR